MTVSDGDEFRLVNLSDPEDIKVTHTNNYPSWNGGLSLNDYLQREKVLASQPAAENGKQSYWALQKLNPETKQWDIVSSMESLSRPAWYKAKGQSINETVAHCIGSVFTPEANRGKGYAAKMLHLASEQLDDWNNQHLSDEGKKMSFNVLWSDVKDYYSRFDYHLTDTKELKLSVDYNNVGDVSWPEGVEEVSLDAVTELAKEDQTQMKANLDANTERDGITRLAIIPNELVHGLTLRRPRFLGPLISKTKKESPSVFGAKYGKCWMLWTQDFGSGKLSCLRLYADESLTKSEVLESINLLIQAALSEACKWQLPAFNLWVQDLPVQVTLEEILELFSSKTPLPPGISAMIHNRTDSWPMVRYHGGKNDKNLHWANDGKYAWF